MSRAQTFFIVLPVIFFFGCSKARVESHNEVLERSASAVRFAVERLHKRSPHSREIPLSPESGRQLKITGGPSKNYLSGLEIPSAQFMGKVEEITQNFRKGIKGRANKNLCSTVPDIDPGDRSLLGADIYTKVSSELSDVVGELSSVSSIFRFVRDEIALSKTFGATQTAAMTLKNRSGSVVDRANLLVALLRAKGYSTQFVSGEIYLRAESAKAYFGANSIQNVFFIISQIYSGKAGVQDGYYSDFYRVISGESYFIVPHLWARVFDGKTWINLDPTSGKLERRPANPAPLLGAGQKVETTAWLYLPDSSGSYVKSQSIHDFMLSSLSVGQTVQPIYLANQQMDTQGGVVSDISPCALTKFAQVEGTGLEYRARIVVKSAATEVLSVERPLATFSEERTYLSHTAGLYSEISNPAAGNVQLKTGDSVLGEFAAPTGSSLGVYVKIIHPEAFSTEDKLVDLVAPYIAGEVYHIGLFARVISDREIVEETDRLLQDVSLARPSKVLMSRVHRLSAMLAHQQIYEAYETGYKLRGFSWLPEIAMTTYSASGQIVSAGAHEREFGIYPTHPGISISAHGPAIAAAFESTEKMELAHLSRFEALLSGSGVEAAVWEQLFGVRGYSAVRILQLAAQLRSQDPVNHNYGFAYGAEFDSSGSTAIGSWILNGSYLKALWPGIQARYGVPGSFFWSANREIRDPASGALVIGYIVDAGASNDAGGAMFLVLEPGASIFSDQGGALSPTEESGLQAPSGEYEGGEPLRGKPLDLGLSPLGGAGSAYPEPRMPEYQGETPATGPGSPNASCNPVDYATGLMWHQFHDINLVGRTRNTGLNFSRTYYSLNQYQRLGNWVYDGDFGPGWTHSFDTRLLDGAKSSSTQELLMGQLTSVSTDLLLINDVGNTVLFKYDPVNGTYSAPAGISAQLSVVNDEYLLKVSGNVKYWFKKNPSSSFAGRLLKVVDPTGEELSFQYDSNGRLIKVVSPFSGDLVFSRDSQGRVSSLVNPKNNLMVSFEYSAGRLIRSRDLDGQTTSYEYNTSQPGTAAQGLLSSITDPIGRKISFQYYANGKVFKEIGFGGAEQAYLYAPYLFQKYTKIIGQNGYSTEYRYDEKFRPVLQVFPDGSRVYKKWSSEGWLQQVRSASGHDTQYTYDSRGNRTGVKRPLWSGFSSVTYDQIFDVPVSINPRVGASTIREIDSENGNILAESMSLGTTLSRVNYAYNSFGRRISVRHNLGGFKNSSDENGFVRSDFDARNPASLNYDPRGRLIAKRWASGRILRFSYDNFDRVLFEEDSHGPDFRYVYDAVGRLIKRQRMAGGTVDTESFEYDERSRLISQTNYLGQRTNYKYDDVGVGCIIQDNPVEITSSEGKSTRFEYDKMGRKVREIQPDGSVVGYSYNEDGDLSLVVDALGNSIQYEYDGNRRLAKTVASSALWSQYNSAKVGSGLEVTSYSYDEADRLIRKEQFLAGESHLQGRYVTEYSYDIANRVSNTTVRHMRGLSTVQNFDSVTFKYYPMAQPSLISEVKNRYLRQKFSYEMQPPYRLLGFTEEPTSEGVAIGLERHFYEILPAATGAVGSLSRDGIVRQIRKFDPSGRLSSVSGNHGSFGQDATFTYDHLGRRTGIAQSNGLSTQYEYDPLDRVTGITITGSLPNVSSEIHYSSDGLVAQIEREIGTFDFGYNRNSELSSIGYSGSASLNSSLVNADLTYDAAGNIATYGLRNFQSVSNFTSQAGTVSYRPGADGLGGVHSVFDSSSTYRRQDLQYLPDGKLRSFRQYDTSDALTRSGEYFYDGLGRRIAKRLLIGGASKTIIYSHFGLEDRILFAKLFMPPAAPRESLFVDGEGIDDHIFEITVSSVRAYKRDHLGSILNSVATGWQLVYGAFGENLGAAIEPEYSLEPVTYGFTGREYDQESGLYYFRSRYYDTRMAKFTSRDPVGIDGGDTNLYRYVNNNPIGRIDPLGLWGVGIATNWSIGASQSPVSARGGVYEFSSGVSIGTEGRGVGFAGVVSAGSGTRIVGLGAGVGVSLNLFKGDVSSNAGTGASTTFLAGPIGLSWSSSPDGTLSSVSVGVGGYGLGFGMYDTVSETQVGGISYGNGGAAVFGSGNIYQCRP